MGNYKYKAFLSYSHVDERIGAWLHRRLENYKIPKYIAKSSAGLNSEPLRLRPIFRDREELAVAGDLGATIEAALDASEHLIVICSPAAARSQWVNQEILYFKRINKDGQIFAMIVDGAPFSGDEDECLPPGLRFELDTKGELSSISAEPLAADIRRHADGRRLGQLKLIAGLIGVGLDELVRRDLKKRNKRVTAVTIASLLSVLFMGALTFTAIDSRKNAEARKIDAEKLTDFMMGDLRDRLEPVGRLDALGSVSDAVLAYYEEQPETKLDCGAIGRKARAINVQTRIAVDKHEIDLAKIHALSSLEILERNAERCHKNSAFLHDRVNAEQWMGEVLQPQPKEFGGVHTLQNYQPTLRKYQKAMSLLETIESQSRSLSDSEQYFLDMEFADMHLLSGRIYYKLSAYPEAKTQYLAALQRTTPYFNRIWADITPETIISVSQAKILDKHADVFSWLALGIEESGDFDGAIEIIDQYMAIYHVAAYNQEQVNWSGVRQYLGAVYTKARILSKQGKAVESRKLMETVLNGAKQLVTNDPTNSDWAEFLANAQHSNEWISKQMRSQTQQNK